jgi:hypothetical protein
MKLLTIKCTPGYPLSGDSGVFAAEPKPAHVAVMRDGARWQRVRRNADAVRVQTAITADVPGPRSAPSLVRRS